MEFIDVLYSLKNRNKNWQADFEDGAKLMSKYKKKAKNAPQSERKCFREFIKVNGNQRLMAKKEESYSSKMAEAAQIIKEMNEAGCSLNRATLTVYSFLDVISGYYENLLKQKEMEDVSQKIFERKIKEPKRVALLSRSHVPLEQYEMGEIHLKTEDFFDPDKARLYYEEAAKNGYSDGLFTLGLYYQLDDKNFEQAKENYDKLIEFNNPNGYSGLALLAKDSSENNPYYDLDKALELSLKGLEKGSGTSMYIHGGLLFDQDKTKAKKELYEAMRLNYNLRMQWQAAAQFIRQVSNNLVHNYNNFAQNFKDGIQSKFDDLALYLYSSKYNMVENYGRFLESLMSLVKTIQNFYASENFSEKAVLNSLGINKELIETLSSQYSNIDEKTQAQIDAVLKALS